MYGGYSGVGNCWPVGAAAVPGRFAPSRIVCNTPCAGPVVTGGAGVGVGIIAIAILILIALGVIF